MFRFRLRTLLLCTFVVAAWLPVVYLSKEQTRIERELSVLRQMSSELSILDEDQLCIRQLQWIWQDIRSWKYYLPKSAEMEVRFATEGINSLGAPPDFDSVRLPNGTHTLSLQTTSRNGTRRFVVYIDSEIVCDVTHPPEWLESNSSSSNNLVNSQSTTYPPDQPLDILVGRFSKSIGNNSLGTVPPVCDAKGFRLWITPIDHVETLAPVFVGASNGAMGSGWGLRNGARVKLGSSQNLCGLIPYVVPSQLEFRDSFRVGSRFQAVSVRPIVDGKPLLPENLTSTLNDPSIQIKESDELKKRMQTATDQLTLTAGYKRYESGLEVEVDLFFDRRYPNRLGFLPRLTDQNFATDGWELVTMFDPSFFLHQLGLDEGQVELSAIDPDNPDPAEWYQIPSDRLEVWGDDRIREGRRLSMQTTIVDYDSVLRVRPVKDSYRGQPIEQRWILPDQDGVTLSVQRSNQPSKGTVYLEATKVTLPAKIDQPVWLEIVPRDR